MTASACRVDPAHHGTRAAGRPNGPHGGPCNRTCRSPFPVPRTPHPAFTLVELLVVISIIAILLIVVGVSWKTAANSRTEFNALNSIKGALRATRARAMELSADVALIYDHTGLGAVYVNAPVGDPRHVAGLDGVSPVPDNQFVLDPTIKPARLDADLLLARLSFVDPAPPNRASGQQITGTQGQPFNEPEFHVAFCFDPSGRLRKRPITALLPSVDLTRGQLASADLNNVLAAKGFASLSEAVYGHAGLAGMMSETGCVIFRRSAMAGTLGASARLVDLQQWLLDSATGQTNGATLVVNPWNGRALAAAEQP